MTAALDQADHRGGGAVLAQRERDGEDHADEGEVHQRRRDLRTARRIGTCQTSSRPSATSRHSALRSAACFAAGNRPGIRLTAVPARPGRRRRRPGTELPAPAEQLATEPGPGQVGHVGPALGGGPRLLELPVGHDPLGSAAVAAGSKKAPAPPSIRLTVKTTWRGRETRRDQGAEGDHQDGAEAAVAEMIIVSRRSNRSASAPAGSCRHSRVIARAVPTTPASTGRVGERQDEQRVGEQADLGAGIG